MSIFLVTFVYMVDSAAVIPKHMDSTEALKPKEQRKGRFFFGFGDFFGGGYDDSFEYYGPGFGGGFDHYGPGGFDGGFDHYGPVFDGGFDHYGPVFDGGFDDY